MNYFKDCICIEDVKETYRKLCFQYHPDVSEDPNANEIMKAINNQYDKAFNEFKNIFKNSKGEIYTDQKTVSETPEEFREIMSKLIHMKGVDIELIGRWIWLTGNTKEYKNQIHNLGFKWAHNKKAWYWHRPEDAVISKGKKTLEEIRQTFGSVKVEKNKNVASLIAQKDNDTTETE